MMIFNVYLIVHAFTTLEQTTAELESIDTEEENMTQ